MEQEGLPSQKRARTAASEAKVLKASTDFPDEQEFAKHHKNYAKVPIADLKPAAVFTSDGQVWVDCQDNSTIEPTEVLSLVFGEFKMDENTSSGLEYVFSNDKEVAFVRSTGDQVRASSPASLREWL